MAMIAEALTERRSAEARRAHRVLWWKGALTSLWAPITFLAIALIPYLFIVELHTPSAAWAQPLMKAFALGMVGYYGALLLARLALPRFRQRRRVRHEADELITEIEAAVVRSKMLEPNVRERLVQQAQALDAKRLLGDVDAMGTEIRKLTELSEKHLTHFRKSPGRDLVTGLLKALAVALVIRTVLIEPYRIPSGSMIPTLEVGDQIFVNKFIYGVRIPFMNWVPFVIVRPPARGDVIVFNNPVNLDEDFIKRIAGVPGDRVELKDNVVYVNGVIQPRDLVSDDYAHWDCCDREGEWSLGHARLYREILDGHSHAVLQELGPPQHHEQGPYVVPLGHVFVLGDNRDHSLDSRYGLRPIFPPQVEYVPMGNIKGKAMIIWLSLAHGGVGSRLTKTWGLRTDRLFLPVR